ncbi:hypothetical protein [Clostridium tagluense]|uniref:hypothetical protein n=1 Tax=Clostridium tagluense TaxID=360422 RepID=UPI001C0BD785|nr:hypothetical protein [Clostridium tagluense]MBU3130620.1 hypothetical protein [Clostridium tagluense]
MDFRRITQEEREKLYDKVWAEPVTTVAQRYNISDNGLRKHCKRLWIPLPPRGHWDKVKAGQKVYKPDLPKVRGELKNYIYNYVIKYRSDIDKLTDDELKASKDLILLTDDTISFINATCSQVQVKNQLRNPHSLIIEHKEECVYRRKRDKELKNARFNTNYYNITKGKYRDNKAMLPIDVSDQNINRAYRILDTLIYAIEDMEGWTKARLDLDKDKAYFDVMRTDFYFEMTEEKRKEGKLAKNEDIIPKLVLSMNSENWYCRTQYSLEYKDKEDEPLETQVGNIIHDMFKTANRMFVEEKLKEREHDRESKERERQRRLEQMRRGELEEINILELAASDWDKAQRIRDFAEHMELKISVVADKEKRDKLLKWITWARDKADWLDPLTEKEDELLGKSKHIFETILEIE